jgi:DNA (cytosine-5)-methyltransferase 1
MIHGDLFSGIGGWSLAAAWCGWQTLFHCEVNPFCQTVLNYHFPNIQIYEDIKETDFTKYRGTIDVLTGSFPCQPFSVAGKRKGTADDRFLWKEMLRAIREIQPSWVVAENVRGIISQERGVVFEQVQTDLEIAGYETQPVVIAACAVDAPHRRDRVWFVAKSTDARSESLQRKRADGIYQYETIANADSKLQGKRNICNIKNKGQKNIVESPYRTNAADTAGSRRLQDNKKKQAKQLKQNIPNWRNFPTQSPVCCGNDGFPDLLDGITFSSWRRKSIEAYGNAIVPQVAFEIFKIIDKINSNGQNSRIYKRTMD